MLLAINFFKCAILIERVLSFEDDSKRAFSDSSLNEVSSWWQQMSVQKPLTKCKPPKDWITEPLQSMLGNNVPVVSYPCAPGR